MKLQTISEALKINESYVEKNISITPKEIRFESLDRKEEEALANAFGDAWNTDDLAIDLVKVAALRKSVK